MKTFLIALFFVCTASGTETADELARRINFGYAPFDNGFDHTPEGRRKTALTNAECALDLFMASDEVPEEVRISYALRKLKEQKRVSFFKEAARSDGEKFAFEVNKNGDFVIDEERTRISRENTAKQIELLEDRLAVIYNPHKAEQAGTGQPAPRPESKSEGGDKPQPESEGRSR